MHNLFNNTQVHKYIKICFDLLLFQKPTIFVGICWAKN